MQTSFIHLTRLWKALALCAGWMLTAGAASTSVSGRLPYPHNIHISYCRSELGATGFTGKVTCYKDDLELAVKNETGAALHTLAAPERAAAVQRYLQNYFSATANGKTPLTLSVPTLDDEGASYNITFKFSGAAGSSGAIEIRSLTIENRILLKEFKDQMNLVTVKAFGREQSYVLSSSKPNAALAP